MPHAKAISPDSERLGLARLPSHLMSRSLKAEEEAKARCGAARIARCQRRRQKAERSRTAKTWLHASHRSQVSHISELHFADRHNRSGDLVRVQVMRGHSSNFPPGEQRVAI